MNLSRLKLRQKLLILLFSVGGIGLAMVKRIIESHTAISGSNRRAMDRVVAFVLRYPLKEDLEI